MSNIKVALDKIRTENYSLQSAINDFKSYDKSYIEKLVSSLDGMHSDYINTLRKTLDCVRDTKAPKLVKQAQEYCNAISRAVNAFDDKDQEIASKFED